MPAELHHGKKIVEVCSIQVNKGKALKNMMQRMNIEKALCIGDDQTDETMFRLNNVNLLKIKVGLEDTSADYRVGDVSAVRDLLKIV